MYEQDREKNAWEKRKALMQLEEQRTAKEGRSPGSIGQTLLHHFERSLDMDKNAQAFPTERGQVQKVVDEGDTLWSIARFFGFATNTGVAELIRHNPHIKNPDKIWPGDTINIPNRWQQKSDG